MTRGALRWTTLAVALVAVVPPAAAKGKADAKADSDDEVITVDDTGPDDAGDAKAKPAAKADKADKGGDDDVSATDDADSDADQGTKKGHKPEGGGSNGEMQKQDLNGHDLGANKKENQFERDRFYVDKSDTKKTEKGTLIQGSLTETSFAYHESGGNLASPATGTPAPDASPFTTLYTELRLQTDFRHISGGRWDARIDIRGRLVDQPGNVGTFNDITPAPVGTVPVTKNTVQSGFLGDNELDIREAWIVRNGIQSDVFIGRQYVPDLGGLKIDGVRIDYASSTKFTLLGFGGLYPQRGSRSITDDYATLQSAPDPTTGAIKSAGRFVGAGGFGAAYRTADAYGSFGGVVLAPLESETPRIFGTAAGYWRYSPQLDFYHFVILDAIGSNATNAGLTNLSLGVNWKPDQRLRGTFSFNRVDTDTLDVQAWTYLESPDHLLNAANNEAYLQRIATNEARGSLSAGLGELQRFELTAALTYRYRGDLSLTPPSPIMGGAASTPIDLPSEQSVEAYGSITDRRSVAGLRLGLDASQTFGVGSVTYDHTKVLQVRAFAGRELKNGHGEWEAEVSYQSSKDDLAGAVACGATLTGCYGQSNTTILSIGGTIYYRINRDWFLVGSAYLNRTSVDELTMGAATISDPTITGITGFFRIAYRF